MRKGQISVEYIMILAFVFAILIPGIIFFYTYTQESQTQIGNSQYVRMGNDMIATATRSAAQGEGSWLTLDLNLPQSVVDITVAGSGTELVVTYNTPNGPTDAVFFSDVPLAANTTAPTGGEDGSVYLRNPHGGRASFRFTSRNGAVGIREVYS